MLVAPALGRSVVTEEHETGMVAFWGVCEQIEKRVVVGKEVLWVARLRSDDIWPLDWVTAEEDGLKLSVVCSNVRVINETYEVETNDVVVAFHCVELDGETTRITSLVWVLTSNGHSGEADEDGRLLADGRQEIGFLARCQQSSCTLVVWDVL